jgi:hypothetical protein
LSAVLSFIGALAITQHVSRAFTATLSFIGGLGTQLTGGAHHYTQALTANLSFISAESLRTFKIIAATFAPSAVLLKNMFKAFAAVLSSAAILTRFRLVLRTFTATLNMTGAFARVLNKTFAATLAFAGAFQRKLAKVFSATLSFVGVFAIGKFQFLVGWIAGSKLKVTGARSNLGVAKTGGGLKVPQTK